MVLRLTACPLKTSVSFGRHKLLTKHKLILRLHLEELLLIDQSIRNNLNYYGLRLPLTLKNVCGLTLNFDKTE